MTAPLRRQQIRIDPVAVFIARVEARAMLWAAGEITLNDVVDELWADAVRDGLIWPGCNCQRWPLATQWERTHPPRRYRGRR